MDSAPSTASQGNTQTFAQPGLLRSLALAGAVCGAGFGALVLALPYLAPEWNNPLLILIGFVFCVGSVVVSVMMLRYSGDTFVVGDDGLRYQSSNRPPVFLPWNEIADVHPENVMQRLVVADGTGERRILIEYHLRGFGELRHIILERARQRTAGAGS